ncbi:MAG: HlyD family efflux transporter periplasmic adaptor subunit [Eudoraea sp.]|uniref:HlyD family secretion protein n=1 Tax=Eudoraea sp. TaxID=1979955 RepID=UPI003265E9AE
MKQVFPKEILESTAEVHQFKHSNKSKSIYLIILLMLIGVFMSLPFLRVDVVSTARGIIKPNKERVHISLISSGQVLFSNLANNKKVAKGDTLLILNDKGIDQKLNLSAFQTRETLSYINDLTLLLNQKRVRLSELSSPGYQKDYLQYNQKLNELQIRVQKIKRDFERYKLLYEKGVIARADYDNYKFEFDLSLSEIVQHRKQQQNSWQADLSQYNNTLKELLSSKEQLMESKSRFVITAPVRGTLFSLNQLEAGSFITAGTVLAQISPDTDLLVECYISPAEIGLIGEQDPANFQIDAYNYNQWGLASGRVIEIGKDVEFLEDKSIFKVRCSLDQKYLLLKNGFKGNLKKGMTLNANFKLSRRTLFELLYDKMDDWLNPTNNSIAHQ